MFRCAQTLQSPSTCSKGVATTAASRFHSPWRRLLSSGSIEFLISDWSAPDSEIPSATAGSPPPRAQKKGTVGEAKHRRRRGDGNSGHKDRPKAAVLGLVTRLRRGPPPPRISGFGVLSQKKLTIDSPRRQIVRDNLPAPLALALGAIAPGGKSWRKSIPPGNWPIRLEGKGILRPGWKKPG